MSLDDLDDVTPIDSPSAAICRLAEHQRALCEAFDRVAPLLDQTRGSDRAYLLESLIDICAEGERSFADCKQAITLMADLEGVFKRT